MDITVNCRFIASYSQHTTMPARIVFTLLGEKGERRCGIAFDVSLDGVGACRSPIQPCYGAALLRFADDLAALYLRGGGEAVLVDWDSLSLLRVAGGGDSAFGIVMSGIWRFCRRWEEDAPNEDPAVFGVTDNAGIVAAFQGMRVDPEEVMALSASLKAFVDEEGVSTEVT